MSGSTLKYWLALACTFVVIYGISLARRSGDSPAHEVTRDSDDATLQSPSGAADKLASDAAVRAEASVSTPKISSDEFTFIDQSGKAFPLKNLRGKVWVGSFFFTNCPAICWRLNQALAGLQETDAAKNVQLVSITCDPDNDTPAALAKYADHFHADPDRWTFLTGEFDDIKRLGNKFFLFTVEKGNHSDRAMIVDRQGRIRGRYSLTEPRELEDFKKRLTEVVAEEK